MGTLTLLINQTEPEVKSITNKAQLRQQRNKRIGRCRKQQAQTRSDENGRAENASRPSCTLIG